MDMELIAVQLEGVKGTLQNMIKIRFRSVNYPSSEGRESDCLVHWFQGALGVALTLVKVAKVKPFHVSVSFCSDLTNYC